MNLYDMHEFVSPPPPEPICMPGRHITPELSEILANSCRYDPIESAASFGRWWLDVDSGELVLSQHAADLLWVGAGWYANLESGLSHAVLEDLSTLTNALKTPQVNNRQAECDIRVISEIHGMRWLRMVIMPEAVFHSGLVAGVLLDITASKHAAMRERLSFESTRLFVGTDTLGTAVTKLIQLVCENLGWEWGAYWALQADKQGQQKLSCQHYWHGAQDALNSFTQESLSMHMTPGDGLVGQVWQRGEARWVEDMQSDREFLRNNSASQCKLRSGYVFPVAYVTDEGDRHSPGVLEFYSCLSRQREAQLPTVSASIGALIAQTAQRLEQQETIRQLAQIDGLTELANRSHFYRMLDKTCLDNSRNKAPFGLIFIDLDRFKPVNDAFGHEAGNVVLKDFAQRLQSLVSGRDLVGRLGGDEFAILLHPDNSSTPFIEQLDVLAKKVLDAAQVPVLFNHHEVAISASIGISIFPENGMNSPDLLRSADTAMYRIKKTGRNALSFFSTSTTQTLAMQQSDLAQRLTMEVELYQAMTNQSLFLEYQPIFDGSRSIVAVEALLRWRRLNGEMVRPDIFIPIAEQSHLIVQIGSWVVKQACHDLAILHQAGFQDLKVHVNMAPSEFTSNTLPEELCNVVQQSGIASHHLCLELTESMLMQQPDRVIPIMHSLRQLGFGISLDDFGMGYSSLSRLKNLPISSMKIDRSFVSGLPDQAEDRAIVRTIIELGRNLRLDIIAEGVETDSQLAFLRQFGDTQIQGFVMCRPQPLNELIRLHQPTPKLAGEVA
ncbi:EAL domain-containing protein [Undibacterium sp. Di26W]|uniref:EAL domain-containing protein n=1 Tax=Undibacterium sp. Di26W TaxID=3413035 RepID=UPI003BF18EB7